MMTLLSSPLRPLKAFALFALLALAIGAASAPIAAAEEDGTYSFCTGNRGSHATCLKKDEPFAAFNESTNGGWSWVWIWNNKHGSEANECRMGDCQAGVALSAKAPGEEEMENTAGGTYYFTPSYIV